MILYFDNVPSHRLKLSTLNQYRSRSLPNTLFISDVSPLEFDEFGTVKVEMPHVTFDDDELKKKIEERSILNHILISGKKV